MMTDSLKPSKRYDHVYAIVRYETDAEESTPIDIRITVKKIVTDPLIAKSEVRRLNGLNADKGSFYFMQVTRFEEVALPVEGSPSDARIEQTTHP
jgi:hypothetical protein